MAPGPDSSCSTPFTHSFFQQILTEHSMCSKTLMTAVNEKWTYSYSHAIYIQNRADMEQIQSKHIITNFPGCLKEK